MNVEGPVLQKDPAPFDYGPPADPAPDEAWPADGTIGRCRGGPKRLEGDQEVAIGRRLGGADRRPLDAHQQIPDRLEAALAAAADVFCDAPRRQESQP